jgi:hypothetical protein
METWTAGDSRQNPLANNHDVDPEQDRQESEEQKWEASMSDSESQAENCAEDDTFVIDSNCVVFELIADSESEKRVSIASLGEIELVGRVVIRDVPVRETRH